MVTFMLCIFQQYNWQSTFDDFLLSLWESLKSLTKCSRHNMCPVLSLDPTFPFCLSVHQPLKCSHRGSASLLRTFNFSPHLHSFVWTGFLIIYISTLKPPTLMLEIWLGIRRHLMTHLMTWIWSQDHTCGKRSEHPESYLLISKYLHMCTVAHISTNTQGQVYTHNVK
jgi:hypothetical protein